MNKINILLIFVIIIFILYLKKCNYDKFENTLNKLFTKNSTLTQEEINAIISNRKIRDNKKNKKFNLVISSIYCNENDYIEEWLDYHLNLNEIDHIYLYSNCKDKSYNKIKKYIKKGKVTWIDFTHIKKEGIGKLNRKPQYFSLIHNYNNFKNEYNYIMHIDIDEFLHIKNGKLTNYLNNNSTIGNFKIERYDFSGDYKIEKQKDVLNSYFYREKIPSSYKSIGRISDITTKINSNKDNFIIDGFAENNYIGSCHEFFTNKLSKTIPKNICKINHYKLKSMNEYIKRPANTSGGRKSNRVQWEELNKKLYQIKDTDILD